METNEKQPGRHYEWYVFAVCFLMIFTVLGFTSSTKGLYLAALTEDLGIPRSLFSINDSCRFITTAVLNFFFGHIIMKMGARRMIFFGFLSLIAAMLVYSFSSVIYTFYIGGVLLGMGLAWSTTTVVGYLVGEWFEKKKGTVMGVILAANGLGGATASQVISPIIYGNAGWRYAYRMTAVLLVIVGAVVLLVVREKKDSAPKEVGKKKPPKRAGTEGASYEGLTISEAKRRPYFYVALVGIFLTGMILQSASGVSSAHMRDVGLAPAFIATVVSVHSLVLCASKILTGLSFDHFGLRVTMLFCNICTFAAILLLAFVSSPVTAFGYGVISSFALPLETVMLPLIALDLFGTRAYSSFMGLFVSVNTLGYALGAPLVNFVFDRTGTYKGILLFLAGLSVLVASAMQYAISAAHRGRTGGAVSHFHG